MHKPIFRLTYRYVPDFYYRRIPHHQAHIDHFRNLPPGIQALGGSTFPYGGGEIFLRGGEHSAVEKLACSDPFVKAGLVAEWTVEPLNALDDAQADDAFRKFVYICK